MTGNAKMIDVQTLIQWLQVMAEEMEFHRGDLYFAGAAKSYRTTIHILQSGVFDTEEESGRDLCCRSDR